MNGWTILVLIYIALGAICSGCLIYASRKKEEASLPLFLVGGGEAYGILLWFAFWPVFAVVAAIELTFPEEKKLQAKEGKKAFTIGQVGITQTKMRPSGRVKIEDDYVDAHSLSGPLEPGEKVEIVSKEMNYYKIQKVEQLTLGNQDKEAP